MNNEITENLTNITFDYCPYCRAPGGANRTVRRLRLLPACAEGTAPGSAVGETPKRSENLRMAPEASLPTTGSATPAAPPLNHTRGPPSLLIDCKFSADW